MTLQDLNEYLELRETLARDQELLGNLKSAAGPRASSISGMPHGAGIRDRVGDLAIEIADMQDDIEAIQRKVDEITGTVQQFICDIPDAQIRLIFRLRFMRGLSWKEVAATVGMYKTENSVRKITYEYINGLSWHSKA